ncbi:MAG: hypothetical protein HY657_00275 [Acidobacteria bacterium]|nr:hypothetical protein [Acidobacteriota bacterium]
MSTGSLEGSKHRIAAAGRVRVCAAEGGGWDVRVEYEGRPAIVEHYTDWHRVERRRARLDATIRQSIRD